MTSDSISEAATALESIAEPAPYDSLPAERKERVEARMAKLDVTDSHSIISFGVSAQRDLTAVSEQILDGVRNKDSGPAGAALNDMMLKVRNLDLEDLKHGKAPGWFARVVLGNVGPLARFLQRYETVSGQIERIQDELESHRMKMISDVSRLDKLFDVTLDYFHDLDDFIAAGERRLDLLDKEEIPSLAEKAKSGSDILDSQRLADLQTARNDLERKVHDLKLTRQVTMQGLPGIRLNQELDKSLATKIQSVLLNTLPLWKNQLAQAVALFRTREAASTLSDVADLTNQMLESNAENLREANIEVRHNVERGVFDIGSIEKANKLLLTTIQESIDITEQGRQQRAEAEQRLIAAEANLREKLASVAD